MMDRTMPDEIVVPRHGYAHDRLACPAENIKHEMHELNFRKLDPRVPAQEEPR